MMRQRRLDLKGAATIDAMMIDPQISTRRPTAQVGPSVAMTDPEVVVVACMRCGNRLSGPLVTTLHTALRLDAQDGTPTIARGLVARDPDAQVTWVQVGRGPRHEREKSPAGALVMHPDDAAGLRSTGTDGGCCGSDGCDGPNRACTNCGVAVATALTDCWTAFEVRFAPDAVALTPATADRQTGRNDE
jgi:hypothetical protein